MSEKSQQSVEPALEEIKAKLESMDHKLDFILKTTPPTPTSDAYDGLPWKNFDSGEGAWISADLKEAVELVRRLENAKGNTVYSGAYRFSLSQDGRFVRRHPVKNFKGGECRCQRMDT